MVLERDQPSRLRPRLNAPRLAVWGCVLGLLSAGLAGAQVGPVVSKDKKLIGWACDRINAREFRMRVVELERHLPFDGLVITVSPDAFELEDGRYARWFGGKRHHRKDFQQVIEDLKATLLKRKLTQLRSLAQRNGWTKDKEPEGPLGRTWREWVKLEKQFGEQAK